MACAAACRDGAEHGALRGDRFAAQPTPQPLPPKARSTPIRPLRRSGMCRGAKGKAFVDFQNDVHRQGPGARRCARASAMSSTPSATPRTAWRPIRANFRYQCHRHPRRGAQGISPAEVGTTTFRPFYTPVTFGALAGAHRGRALPAGSQVAAAWLGQSERRRLRRFRPLVSLGLFSRVTAKRPGARASDREVLNVRAQCRALRRLDARQDRDFRAGCG